MYFHGARFSNYEAWLTDPTHIKPSAQVVWQIVGQEILNGDVGGGFSGIQITSGFFQLWRASGITSELQLYATAIGGLVMAAAMFFAGWFHYHKAAPKLEWFQNVESMLNHHLAGLLGLGSLAWAGHQIHISMPINKLLDAGVDPKEIPLPHDLILNRAIMADLYPSFAKGLAPFFTLNWSEYSDFLTFKGGLNPVTGGLWLSDEAHHHLAIAVLFIIAGHMYRTNWGIGHSMKTILEAHKGPFTGNGHTGLYEILTTSWHAQLAINLALFGSLSIIVAHHMYSMPPYPYLATDYATQLSLFTHHMWIGGFCVVGAGAHAAIFMVRDYDPTNNYNNLLDRVIRHRDAIISHLNWVCIFLGFHSFGLYIHNDTMSALGRPQDMFSDTAIQLQPVFAQWVQNTHFLAPGLTAPNALAATSATWGGDVVAVAGKVAMMPISLGTADFMVQMVDHVKFRYMLEQTVFDWSPDLILFMSMGIWENLSVRFNQQETFCLNCFQHFLQVGSSETTRETLFYFPIFPCLYRTYKTFLSIYPLNNFSIYSFSRKNKATMRFRALSNNHENSPFSDFQQNLPQHKTYVNDDFLYWFIGFVEGDGSFLARGGHKSSWLHSDNSLRCDFTLVQKEAQCLYNIKKELGFGLVSSFEKNGTVYWKWTTSKREHIIRLVHLFNGNFILEKRRERFALWLEAINKSWLNEDNAITLKPWTNTVSLNNAWLSGFTDADGGFWTNATKDFYHSKLLNGNARYGFQLKFYITQLGELEVLEKIQNIVGATNKITTSHSSSSTTQKYNRLEITALNPRIVLIEYFNKYPLKLQQRRIDYLRWVRVHGYQQRGLSLSERSAVKLARLLEALEESQLIQPLHNDFDQLTDN